MITEEKTALVNTTVATMTGAPSGNTSEFFEDDDEEILRLLLDSESRGDDTFSRLKGLGQRFMEDHGHLSHQPQWSAWTSSANQLQFSFSEAVSNPSGSSSESTGPYPDAFDSEGGQKHLRATTSLLNVSERRAVQLTMSSLRDVKESKNVQALLGTRALLEKVMEYHYRQRTARIAVILELLRLEQAADGAPPSKVLEVLDLLDSSYTNNMEKRGLFRYFVSTICQNAEGQKPSPLQLQRAKELSADAPTSLDQSLGRPFDQTSRDLWHQFVAKCLNSNQNRIYQERLGAMEALVALLYFRIEGGVRRADYLILLLAFQSAEKIFAASPESRKLSQLAAMVCVECLGLWNAFDETTESNNWVAEHPFLEGVAPTATGGQHPDYRRAETEMRSLRSFLEKRALQIGIKQEAPESLAILSFGLLQLLTYDGILKSSCGADINAFWHVFREQGQAFIELSSEKLSALDYLQACMEKLVSPKKYSDGRPANLPYDWLFVLREKTSPMETGSGEQFEWDLDVESMTFASIGHELLSSLISAFGDTILSVQHSAACQNLALICELASCIYRNSPSLCHSFWQHVASEAPESNLYPLCRVVESSATLAQHAFRVYREKKTLKNEQILGSLVPIMQLLGSLCCISSNVEAIFEMAIPASLLQKSLLACAHGNQLEDVEFTRNKAKLLDSLETFSRVGNSASCRAILRGALDKDLQLMDVPVHVSGPGFLVKVLESSNLKHRKCVLNIAACLLKEAPVTWTLRLFKGLRDAKVVTPGDFEEEETMLAVSLVYNEFARSLIAVAFSESVGDTEAIEFWSFVWEGVVKLAPILSLCLSNVTRKPVNLRTAASIMDFFSVILESVVPTLLLHKSAALGEVVVEMRDALLEMLASGIGESVMFYALLPLSSSMGYMIEAYAEEQNILQYAAMKENNSTGKYGLWHSAATRNSVPASETSETELQVKEIVQQTPIRFKIIPEKTGVTIEDVMLATGNALNLLRLWAVHVSRQDCGAVVHQPRLEDAQRDRLLSLSPQKLLGMRAKLPQPLRSKSDVKVLWDAVSPTNIQLLTRYFEANIDGSILETALDFLHACVLHVKIGTGEVPRDMGLFSIIQKSKLPELVAPLAEASLGDAIDGNSKENMALCVLAFRFLSITLPVANVESFGKTLMKSAFSAVEATCKDLHKVRERKPLDGFEHVEVLDKLQLSVACLGFLRAIWIDGDRLESKLELRKQFDDESTTFLSLAKVLMQHAHTKQPQTNDGASAGARGCLFAFLATAVDFLCIVTDYALSSGDSNCSLVRMLRENAYQIIAMPKYFMSVDSCSGVASSTLAFAASIKREMKDLSRPDSLLQAFPITASNEFADVFFNVDVSAFTSAVRPLSIGSASFEDLKRNVLVMSLARFSYSSQAILLLHWKRFATSLIRVSKNGATPSGAGQRAVDNPYLNSSIEAIEVLTANAILIGEHQVALNGLDIGEVAKSMSSLVLVLVYEGLEFATPGNPDLLISILGLIGKCTSKLFDLLESDTDMCCRVVGQLLASAVGIFEQYDLPSANVAGSIGEAIGDLLLITSKQLKLLEGRRGTDHDCFKTCIVLLSVVTSWSLDCHSSFPLAKMLEDLSTIKTLVRLVTAYSSRTTTPQTTKQSVDEYIDILEAHFDLIFTAQNIDLIEVFNRAGALHLLIRNPIFSNKFNAASSSSDFRGYIPTQERFNVRSSTSFVGGIEDPSHLLWRKGIRCWKAILRTTRKDSAMKERYQGLVAHFLRTHQNYMMSCLETITEKALSRNILEEATLILSLFAELCRRPCKDRSTFLLILEKFGGSLLLIVARLSGFLGASSLSREFLDVLSDNDEEADAADLGMRLSPYNQVHNTTHEAIRYSHFANKFRRAVTKEDFESSISQTQEDLRSTTDFQKHAKALNNCEFSSFIEVAAAECLFSAVSLLWETHPVNESFVLYSQAQASRIDVMALVNPDIGQVVAYTSDAYSSPCFGEIKFKDTVDKMLFVKDLVSGKNEAVPSCHVVGVEDVNKRRAILRYVPAPDSASDLEASQGSSATVGHLVLALRWCAGPPSNSNPVVKRLASLLSLVLGCELKVHALISSPASKPEKEVQRLQKQLLDLFGDVPEIAAGHGRLKHVLSELSWVKIRQQLAADLESGAETQRDAMSNNDAMAIEDGYSSSRSNPFQGLAMEY